jgi:hypothetical protein
MSPSVATASLVKPTILLYFLAIGIVGIRHGFPLVNLFTDESFFAYGPLVSIASGTLLPQDVLYGTVTFYLSMVTQGIVLGVLFIYTGCDRAALEAMVMRAPHLAYLAPRLLNLFLFLAMVFLAIRTLGVGKSRQRAYAPWLILVLMSNLVILTFLHSGKQWFTSIFLVYLSALSLSSSPRTAVFSASLAFANFPLMGVFWLLILVQSCHAERRRQNSVGQLLLIGFAVPVMVTLLNPGGTYELWRQLIQGYIFPRIADDVRTVEPSLSKFGVLYWRTLLSYLHRILLTSLPTVGLLSLLCLGYGRVRNTQLLRFASIGLPLYLLAISLMVYSEGAHSFYRYLLPFHVLFLLTGLAVELRASRVASVVVGACVVAAIYTAGINTWNLARPTTYNAAYEEIQSRYSSSGFLVLSKVSALTTPINFASARLIKEYTPDFCAYRCRYALEHDFETGFEGRLLFIHDDLIETIRRREVDSRIVEVDYDWKVRGVSAEEGLGNYFIKAAWVPTTLGQSVLIDGKSLTPSE